MENLARASEDAVQRDAVIEVALGMARAGLNRGTAGNASVRCTGSPGCLITPTGMPYEDLTRADIVELDWQGQTRSPRKPSSEWRFHTAIYEACPDSGAVLHAHSSFATALACIGRDIPAFHYMIARFGGATIRCAPYATFGTVELSAAAIAALENRCACLLANHGMLVYGRSARHALALAIEFETLCEHYWRALQIGVPHLLDDAEMHVVLEKFKTYGQDPGDKSA